MQTVSVSTGEALDKLSILRVKHRFVSNVAKTEHIKKEMGSLIMELENDLLARFEMENKELEAINTLIWIEEDRIRQFIYDENLSDGLIECSTLIPKLNDIRFSIKNRINLATESQLQEQKQHRPCEVQ